MNMSIKHTLNNKNKNRCRERVGEKEKERNSFMKFFLVAVVILLLPTINISNNVQRILSVVFLFVSFLFAYFFVVVVVVFIPFSQGTTNLKSVLCVRYFVLNLPRNRNEMKLQNRNEIQCNEIHYFIGG